MTSLDAARLIGKLEIALKAAEHGGWWTQDGKKTVHSLAVEAARDALMAAMSPLWTRLAAPSEPSPGGAPVYCPSCGAPVDHLHPVDDRACRLCHPAPPPPGAFHRPGRCRCIAQEQVDPECPHHGMPQFRAAPQQGGRCRCADEVVIPFGADFVWANSIRHSLGDEGCVFHSLGAIERCPECGGYGEITFDVMRGEDHDTETVKCKACGGSGTRRGSNG